MTELSDSQNKVLSDIEQHGCHIIHVMEDEIGPGFSYSIGLFHTFKHPEIIFIGLNPELAQVLINNICSDIKKGKSFYGGQSYAEILDNFECRMIEAKKEFYDEHFGQAQDFYKSNDFPVLQCVYPTTSGVFPWDENAPEGFAEHQPILGSTTV
jgi:hypothetical protein